MQPFTVVIPFRNGHRTLPTLLGTIPRTLPVLVVDDVSEASPDLSPWPNARLLRLRQRGYFAGAVNAGVRATDGAGVLVLNQDVAFSGTDWLAWIEQRQGRYAVMGHGQMKHPAWPNGYVQGQFMYLDRQAWDRVGPFNRHDYPLWGCTAEYQLRACRKGYAAYPVSEIPGLTHARPRGESFGESIQAALEDEPAKRELLVRTPPQVSVIVTSHNYGRYLTDCLNSLIGGPTSLGAMPGQSYQSFEVIIVDDASTDQTEKVGRSLADPWKGIRYIRRNVKGGTPAANNTGIRASFGRYITILCADDMREPSSLEALVRVVEQHPKAVAYDDMQVFGHGQRLEWHPDALPNGKRYPGRMEMGEYGFDSLVEKNMMHAGILFDRRAWDATGGYDERMTEGREDWQFNIALGLHGFCGKRVQQFGYLYRRERQNRSLGNQGHEWREKFQQQLREIFPDLYRGVKPMACCGGGAQEASPGFGGESRMAQLPDEVGAEGMVLIEYLGGNAGDEPWYGPAPRRTRYIFGGSKKTGYVDRRDAEYFINIKENRRNVFQLAETPEVQEVLAGFTAGPPATLPAVMSGPDLGPGLDPADPALGTETGDPAKYPTFPKDQGEGKVFSYPLRTEDGVTIEGDPREYSVKDYVALLGKVSLSPAQVERLSALESDGQSRKGVLAALKGKAHASLD